MKIETRLSPNRQIGELKSPKAIMLHHTGGGTYQSNINHFLNATSHVSCHYLIGKNGECARIANDEDRAWHAGTGRALTLSNGFVIPENMGNDYCFGIFLVNAGDNRDPYTTAQYLTLDTLIASLRLRYGALPIIDHKMYSSGKIDMGANFPLSNYIRYGRRYPLCPYAEPAATLRSGMNDAGVKWLQWHLSVKGYSLVIDGIFGPNTLAAVRAFQGSNGLVVDGLVGPLTKNKLKEGIAKCPYSEPANTLGSGAKGSGVQWIQWHLNLRGYDLATDGVFGPLTLAAARDFQSKSGLTVDGLVGPLTRNKLKADMYFSL
ncbi:MAG: N-acetylmuramoyl-L-alanine amidase [Gracilibacteraceae bacterium]|jgi:N-acetyl-anhydromuramyl-L-alanine amidase AmpD|nr:N-acetylmuramoyl-L-alanine amidase [Gracilibacteraceae bacterium]